MIVDLERAKTDLVYFVENVCKINGEPIKLTPAQKLYIAYLEKTARETKPK